MAGLLSGYNPCMPDNGKESSTGKRRIAGRPLEGVKVNTMTDKGDSKLLRVRHDRMHFFCPRQPRRHGQRFKKLFPAANNFFCSPCASTSRPSCQLARVVRVEVVEGLRNLRIEWHGVSPFGLVTDVAL